MRFLAALALFTVLLAQNYVCPMDPDVRSDKPGVCPRCGMKLVLGIPDPVDYPLHLRVEPPVPRPGQPVELTLRMLDPKTGAAVTHFQVVHEKLCHLFIVSQDLRFFVHDHPVLQPDGTFRLETRLPGPGMYRVLADFYPENATPQLAPATILVPGTAPVTTAAAPPASPDVQLTTEPSHPLAGQKTLLFVHLKHGEGLEKYLGAWAHLLAASDDLVDMIHTHPFIADGRPDIQFTVIFPRPRLYRLWIQFQQRGTVNTVVFDVPVAELK